MSPAFTSSPLGAGTTSPCVSAVVKAPGRASEEDVGRDLTYVVSTTHEHIPQATSLPFLTKQRSLLYQNHHACSLSQAEGAWMHYQDLLFHLSVQVKQTPSRMPVVPEHGLEDQRSVANIHGLQTTSVDAHCEYPDTSVVSLSNLSAWQGEITVQAAKQLKSNAELLLWACESIIRSTRYKGALSYTLIPLTLVVCACLNSHNKFSSVDAQ